MFTGLASFICYEPTSNQHPRNLKSLEDGLTLFGTNPFSGEILSLIKPFGVDGSEDSFHFLGVTS